MLVKKETLDNSLKTIIGAPVIINHKDITPENADELRVGVISDAYYNEKDGWYWCEGIIWDETAQNLITDKNWSVSCSYDFLEEDDKGGSENNIPYDREFTKLNFVHLALVDNPRYERANIVFNSKTTENSFPEHAGRPGQVGGSLPRSNSMPTSEDYKNPLQDYKLPAISQEIFKKLNKSEKPIILKKNIIEKNKNNHPEVNIEEYNDILSKGLYQTDVVFKTKKDDDYFNFIHYDKNSNSQVLVELSETKDNYEIVNFYKLSDKSIQRKLKQAIKRIDNEGGQVLIDIKDKTSKVGDLSNLEIDSVYIIPHFQDNLNPNIKKHEVNNSKGEDMALLEELKKLITKVENDKGEDEKEKIENEKVDKRKLIDEVAGIMKSAGADDELIRTAIAKMEKIGYDDSKSDTSDNKKTKNEKDEEEKADNKKVKNEDKEDKEKVEELEKETKKDVDNKCKNNVDNSKPDYFAHMNKVYNCAMVAPKELKTYVSRTERLEAGNKY